VPIYDEKLRYATSIDMVGTMKDSSGRERLVLVELKTGFEGIFEDGAHQMNLPSTVPPMKDSPRNQATLQVLMARLTLKHRYGIDPPPLCCVINVNAQGAFPFWVHTSILAAEDHIYNHAYRLFTAPKNANKTKLATLAAKPPTARLIRPPVSSSTSSTSTTRGGGGRGRGRGGASRGNAGRGRGRGTGTATPKPRKKKYVTEGILAQI
jgi:hypothetical protein